MAFVVPLERIGRFGDDMELQTFSAMRLVGMLALAAMLAQVLIRRQQIELPRPLVLYFLIVVMAFASIGHAFDPLATRSHAISMMGNLLMFVVLVQAIRDWPMIERMVLAWLAATLLIGIYQIYDWHFDSAIIDGQLGQTGTRFSTTWDDVSELSTLGNQRRAFGTTSNAAVYGINLLLALPFVLLWLRRARGMVARLFWLATLGIVLYNVLLTNTRFVLVFCAILLITAVVSGLVRLTVYTVAGAGVALAGVIAALPASIWNRVLNIQAYSLENATNLQWRFELWRAALKIGMEHWFAGIGVGNRTEIVRHLDPTRFEATWIMAHNEFLQVFYELGILGLVLFVLFLGSLLLRAYGTTWRLRRLGQDDAAWFTVACGLALFIGIIFSLQVDAFHFPLKGWWLAAGLLIAAERLSRLDEAARKAHRTVTG
jgi:O-antigen ligase